MSYEYKELIKAYTEYIMDDYEVVDYIEANKELDYVYALATKSDEYEAKAKAWDKLNEYVSTTPFDGINMGTLKNRLNRFMAESGELDEL